MVSRESTWPPKPYVCPECGNRPIVDGGHKRGCAFVRRTKEQQKVSAARVAGRRSPKTGETEEEQFKRLRRKLEGE